MTSQEMVVWLLIIGGFIVFGTVVSFIIFQKWGLQDLEKTRSRQPVSEDPVEPKDSNPPS